MVQFDALAKRRSSSGSTPAQADDRYLWGYAICTAMFS